MLAGAEETQAVPFEVSTLPVVPTAERPVPPLAAGKVPVTFVPKLTKVVEVVPVPPLAIGSVPLTAVAKPILPQLGAAPTPPEISALPTATSASLSRVDVVSAYNKSPTA